MNLLRSDLYRLVWSYPGVRVGALLGVTSSALTRICRRYAVPAPPRGYWRKLQVGQSVPKPALPAGVDSQLRFVVSQELRTALEMLPSAAEMSTTALVNHKKTEMEAGNTSELERAVANDDSAQDCGPAPLRIEVLTGPSLEVLLALSEAHRERQEMENFIRALEDMVSTQPAPVAAVLALWLHRATVVIRMEDPVERVMEACRHASWRQLPPRAK